MRFTARKLNNRLRKRNYKDTFRRTNGEAIEKKEEIANRVIRRASHSGSISPYEGISNSSLNGSPGIFFLDESGDAVAGASYSGFGLLDLLARFSG
jgi:hypothetical protein